MVRLTKLEGIFGWRWYVLGFCKSSVGLCLFTVEKICHGMTVVIEGCFSYWVIKQLYVKLRK